MRISKTLSVSRVAKKENRTMSEQAPLLSPLCEPSGKCQEERPGKLTKSEINIEIKAYPTNVPLQPATATSSPATRSFSRSPYKTAKIVNAGRSSNCRTSPARQWGAFQPG